MKADCFLDTNILIYAVSANPTEGRKRTRAAELLVSNFGVSTQVIQEFYTISTRKPDQPLSPFEALEWIDKLVLQPCLTVDLGLIRIAIAIAQRYRINYWDGAIVAAAETLGATTLYTEDLSHGQSYGAVRVIDPFQ